jgi:L-amino acid N-acyltransferase YncA
MWYRSNKNEAINIRFLSPEDANDVFEIYSDPQVTKNTNWERESVTFEAIKDFVDECIESFAKGVEVAIPIYPAFVIVVVAVPPKYA